MIKVASYAGDFERALAVLDDMEAAGVAPSAAIWGSLLVACGKVVSLIFTDLHVGTESVVKC